MLPTLPFDEMELLASLEAADAILPATLTDDDLELLHEWEEPNIDTFETL